MGPFVGQTISEQLREQEARIQVLMKPTIAEQLRQHEERMRLFRPTILEQLREQQERMRALTAGPVVARQLHELQLQFGALANERIDTDRPDSGYDVWDGQRANVDPLDAT